MIDDYYTVTAASSEEPITLDEAKDWCRVSTTDDDVLITSLITTARMFGENYCNRIFVDTTYDCFFSDLDTSNMETYSFIQLRRAPLSSITDVSVYSGGSYTTTTDYNLRQTNGYSRLIFANGISPDLYQIYPLRVQAVFGYGGAADVPEEIKTAVKQHVAYLYENRGDVVSEGTLPMPLETKLIYSRHYRILNTF